MAKDELGQHDGKVNVQALKVSVNHVWPPAPLVVAGLNPAICRTLEISSKQLVCEFSFLPKDLLLQIRSELVDEFVNHAERNGHRDPGECGTNTAIFLRIVGI